jgi:hypothetical protein
MVDFHYLVADILAVHGTDWVSRTIERLTHGCVSHVGLLIGDNPPVVIEAIAPRVKVRPFYVSIEEASEAWVIHDRRLTNLQRSLLVNRALEFCGEGYGYWDLLMQLCDVLFKTRFFTERLSFRLIHRPICSALDAIDYSQLGVEFGCEPRDATPNDIYEFALSHPEIFTVEKVK